ncbi:hypothetical protein [Arsenicibacter rosenii]|uniref:Uncharacterized protein n=1 Tax=Arsenicibacter rosenii TaxID=1750698 RepID=A0A1S2VGQ8_9BACT|nr:hypothetical protein [Arsenicibacter rosenii]OIN57435.1 hypothetical protein BLX24_19590 [Arsenicibacter rosenii]
MLAEIIWIHLFRIVQFGLRYGALLLTIGLQLEKAIDDSCFENRSVYGNTYFDAFTEFRSTVNSQKETGEGVGIVDRNEKLINPER